MGNKKPLKSDDKVSIPVNFDQAMSMLAKKADKAVKDQQSHKKDKKPKGSN